MLGVRRSGFSLLEMLIVIAIMGLIAGLVFTRLGGTVSDSKVKTTRTQLQAVAAAVERFNTDAGRLPTEEEMRGFRALIDAPVGVTGWDGPYLAKDKAPTDGWNRELIYKIDEKWGFRVQSYGADGQPGGDDVNADIDNRS